MSIEVIKTDDIEVLFEELGFKVLHADGYSAFKREKLLITLPTSKPEVRPAYLDVIAAQLEDFGVMPSTKFWEWCGSHKSPSAERSPQRLGYPVMRRGPRPS
jgi:hypothetical protein